MKKYFSIFVIFSLAFFSCGKTKEKEEYDCGGPKETPVTGQAESLERLQEFKHEDSNELSNIYKTEPSGLLWSLTYEDAHPVLKIGDTTYIGYFENDTNKWKLKLSETDDQIFGSIYPFSYTRDSAIDEGHCGTTGFKFEIYYDEKQESFEHTLRIL